MNTRTCKHVTVKRRLMLCDDTLTEVLDGALSKLLWLDTEGVRVRRGGNDLLWCCRCECKGLGAVSKEPVLMAPWYCG